MSKLKELGPAIRKKANELICQSHPNVCELRDRNYQHLEALVLNVLEKNEKVISIQTALAQLEMDLSEVDTDTL